MLYYAHLGADGVAYALTATHSQIAAGDVVALLGTIRPCSVVAESARSGWTLIRRRSRSQSRRPILSRSPSTAPRSSPSVDPPAG